MTAKRYIELTDTLSAGEIGDLVSLLPDPARAALYNELVAIGCTKLVRPLYYNYETQKFVEGINS